MSVVAGRYAAALFAVAEESGAVDAVHEGLVLIDRLLTEVPALAGFLNNPEIEPADKAGVLRTVGQHRWPPLVTEFVLLLVRKGRLADWTAIHETFGEQFRRARRLERAVVRSARPLDAQQLQAIDTALERWRGTQIDLVNDVDPTLLGGLQVRIGSLLVDGSVRAHLATIAQRLSTLSVT